MAKKILSLPGFDLVAKAGGGSLAWTWDLTHRIPSRRTRRDAGEPRPDPASTCDGTVSVEDVRAVATEAALATALDGSPAVLPSLWAQDQRLHPSCRSSLRRGH